MCMFTHNWCKGHVWDPSHLQLTAGSEPEGPWGNICWCTLWIVHRPKIFLYRQWEENNFVKMCPVSCACWRTQTELKNCCFLFMESGEWVCVCRLRITGQTSICCQPLLLFLLLTPAFCHEDWFKMVNRCNSLIFAVIPKEHTTMTTSNDSSNSQKIKVPVRVH